MELKIVVLTLLLLCCQACTPQPKAGDSQRTVIKQSFSKHAQTRENVELVYQPARMLTESPLALDIQAPENWQLSTAQLVGISMEMPVLPLFFSKGKSSAAGAANWQTEFLIGACADEQMTWRLELVFKDETGALQRLSDEFQVFRR
jgi:hypothetical protein